MTTVLLGAHLAPAIGITGYTLYNSSMFKSASGRAEKVEALKNLNFIYNNFACSARNLNEGRTWTLLSNAFLHGDVGHILFNGIGFWSFGSMVASVGARAFLPIFWGGVLAGNVTSLVLESKRGGARSGRLNSTGDRNHVGMSGGVLSLSAAWAAVFPRWPFSFLFVPIPVPAWLMTGLFGGYSIFADTNGFQGGVDHMGHLGGMVFGLASGLILKGRMKAQFRAQGRPWPPI